MRGGLIAQSAREPFETRAREIPIVRVLNRIFTSDSPMRMINCLQGKKQCFTSDPWDSSQKSYRHAAQCADGLGAFSILVPRGNIEQRIGRPRHEASFSSMKRGRPLP